MLLDDEVVRTEGGVCHLQGDLDELALRAGLHALLGARLDRLDPHARATLERGAIQGEVFDRGAVLELSAPELRPSVPTTSTISRTRTWFVPPRRPSSATLLSASSTS